MVCLKPCDTYSFNQLIKEHRVNREKAYIVGVGCKGKLDIEKIKNQNIKGIEAISGAELTDEAEVLKIQTIYGSWKCDHDRVIHLPLFWDTSHQWRDELASICMFCTVLCTVCNWLYISDGMYPFRADLSDQ